MFIRLLRKNNKFAYTASTRFQTNIAFDQSGNLTQEQIASVNFRWVNSATNDKNINNRWKENDPIQIHTVSDAICLINNLKLNEKIWSNDAVFHSLVSPLKFPFGIWFRGESVEGRSNLVPSVFRTYDGYCDETSISMHFRAYNSEYHKQINEFSWLSLMQHYKTPTRLLDWSESILVALYFAVENPKQDDHNGLVWTLNALRLNNLTALSTSHVGVVSEISFNAVVRAGLAWSNDIESLLKKESLKSCSDYDAPNNIKSLFTSVLKKSRNPTSKKEDSDAAKFLKNLASPVAVYPMRSEERIKAQQGTFTLFGGKQYHENQAQDPNKSNALKIPKYEGLFSLNERQKNNQSNFLGVAVVPKEAKARIRNELSMLGIKGSTLYPGLESFSHDARNVWAHK